MPCIPLVTTPVALTVATDGLSLLHVPFVAASLNVSVAPPEHICPLPVIPGVLSADVLTVAVMVVADPQPLS